MNSTDGVLSVCVCVCVLGSQFNDNTVSESTWETLCVESVGGHHNTSAYCLIYIDCNRSELMDGESLNRSELMDGETGGTREAVYWCAYLMPACALVWIVSR